MKNPGFPWIHIAVAAGIFTLVCRMAGVWPVVSGYTLLIATLAIYIFMAKNDWVAWLPIAVTGVLMYLARITNIGVTHYNIFMLVLLAWSTFLIFFYRQLALRRRKDAAK